MRLDKEDQTTKTPIQSPLLDLVVAPHLEHISHENKTAHSISESHSPSCDDYFAIVARATNDAVRDWDVRSNGLSWPQGLERLLGYDPSTTECNDIGFWQKNLHPADRARIASSIRDTFVSSSDHWSGEYRFRRVDGDYLNVLEPVVVEVNSIITNLERSLLRLIGENISVVCHLHHEKEGAHIKADPSQITQIILNLAVNARDAMPKGGQLTLETAIVDLTKEMESPFLCGDFVSGHYVLIKIADTGIGMNDEAKVHLFEPFFTTKVDRERSGLGLATCYGIVHQSGGHLRVESEQGKGTTVQIYLPRVPAPPPPSYKRPTGKKPRGGTETILVLEDDISVRHISVRMLRGLGYEVIEAANGSDARRLLSENGGRRVDLLLTDLVMPQVSGRRFADSLRAAHPNIKVLFISGYLEESLQPGDRCEPGMFFLPKPFDSEQLATKVREALDR